jgi:hypothetical protein
VLPTLSEHQSYQLHQKYSIFLAGIRATSNCRRKKAADFRFLHSSSYPWIQTRDTFVNCHIKSQTPWLVMKSSSPPASHQSWHTLMALSLWFMPYFVDGSGWNFQAEDLSVGHGVRLSIPFIFAALPGTHSTAIPGNRDDILHCLWIPWMVPCLPCVQTYLAALAIEGATTATRCQSCALTCCDWNFRKIGALGVSGDPSSVLRNARECKYVSFYCLIITPLSK